MKALIRCAVVALAAAAMFSQAAAAQPGPRRENCLYYRDLDQLHAVSGTSAVATTRRDAYMITFRNYCQAMASAAFFVLRRPPLGQCVRPGDQFGLSVPAAPCIVQDVSYLRSVRISNGR